MFAVCWAEVAEDVDGTRWMEQGGIAGTSTNVGVDKRDPAIRGCCVGRDGIGETIGIVMGWTIETGWGFGTGWTIRTG